MAHHVSTDGFDGPLDVLLRAVVSEEVELYDIALSDIVTAFCREVDRLDLDAAGLERATEFLVLAAVLIELKSRRLLPTEAELDVEAELAAYGDRDVVLARLIEGRTFAFAATLLRRLAAEAARRHPRRAGPDERFVDLTPDPLAGVGPDALAAALVAALTPRPVPQLTTEHIRVPAATVQDCVADLVARLPECGPVSFRELTGHITDRVVVVAHFLALLELFKLGYADLTQAERFGDIGVRWIADAAGVDVDAVLAAVARDAVAA